VSPPAHALRPLAEVAAAAPAPGLGGISLGERSLSWVGAAIDGAAIGAARLLVRALFSGSAEDAERWRRSAAPFLEGEWGTDPTRYLLDEDALPTLLHAAALRRRSITGGEIVTRRLTMLHRRANADEPYDPTAGARSGDAILLEHWQHTGRAPLATAIALHGFGMGHPRFDAFALHAESLFRHGLDVALLTLPHHGGRMGAGARFSGEGFVTLDVGALNASLRAAIGEARAVRRWLRDSGASPVGFLGLSLGGYVAATIAGIEEDLAFAIAIAPPVCIGDLAWHFAGDAAGGGSHAAPFDLDTLRAAYRVHSPLTYPRRAPRDRLLIVAGAGDRIVPAEHPGALWAHWERPAIEWFGGSHLAPFGRAKIASAAIGHLRRLGIV
jgi:hypothetical protein